MFLSGLGYLLSTIVVQQGRTSFLLDGYCKVVKEFILCCILKIFTFFLL